MLVEEEDPMSDRAAVKAAILNGPDCPARRFLLHVMDLEAKERQPEQKAVDSKRLDRLREKPAPVAGPVPFDLNDPETPLNAEGD